MAVKNKFFQKKDSNNPLKTRQESLNHLDQSSYTEEELQILVEALVALKDEGKVIKPNALFSIDSQTLLKQAKYNLV